MEDVGSAWDKFVQAAADLHAAAQSRALQATAANKLVQARQELEAVLLSAEFELSAAEEALLHQRLFVPEAEQPPGPTTVLDDLVAENLGPAGATGDPQPVAASTVPFMSDMLMDFDMDSNF